WKRRRRWRQAQQPQPRSLRPSRSPWRVLVWISWLLRSEFYRRLGDEHRGSGKPPRLEGAVRRRRVAQRVGRADLHLEDAAQHEAEELLAWRREAAALGDVVAEPRTRHRERAVLGEEQQVERRDVARSVPVVHQHAEAAHAGNGALEGVLADPVEHRRHAAGNDLPYLLREVRVEKDM